MRQVAALVIHTAVVVDVVDVAVVVDDVFVVAELFRTRLPLVVSLVQRPNELTLIVLCQARDERPRGYDLQIKFTKLMILP